MLYGYDDDDGQVDGDTSGAVQFQSSLPSVDHPWMREGLPPWHLWGNSIIVDPVTANTEDSTVADATGQLIKASYKRPESWHWVFQSRILRAPGGPDDPIASVELDVFFDLIVGVGRSQTVLAGFEHFNWRWVGTQIVPFDRVLWSTSGLTPALAYTPLNPGPPIPDETTRRLVSQISAQDIQLNCRVRFAQEDSTGATAGVEVSAFFAPKTHVRPDWYQNPGTPPEGRFAGSETGGK